MNVTVIIESGINIGIIDTPINQINVDLVGIQGPPGMPGSGGSGISTGNYYPLNSNPSGYITTGQTGNFGASGNFYPLNSNPSGYITTGQTGAFGISVNTGQLTGAFYPLNNNPYNYITSTQTGNFVTSSQTGIFITTGQTGAFGNSINTGSLTGQFYPLHLNPSGYLTGFNSGLYTLNSNTGILTGVFYPYNSNPSGFITTGNADNRYYINQGYITGNNSSKINFINETLVDEQGSISLYWNQRVLTDSVQNYSVQYNDRFLRDAAQNYVLDWNNKILSGSWTSNGLVVDNGVWTIDGAGNFNTNGSIVGGTSIQASSFLFGPQIIYNDGTTISLAANIISDHQGRESIDWSDRWLVDTNDLATIDWQNKFLFSSWTLGDNALINSINTGQFLPLLSIVKGANSESITNGYDGIVPSHGISFYRLWSDTTTGIEAGLYSYATPNWGGGLIFQVKSGDGIQNGPTITSTIFQSDGNVNIGTGLAIDKLRVDGTIRAENGFSSGAQNLSNLFYPLYNNPAFYLTGFNSGIYTLNSNTGNFITNTQTGQFASNISLVSTGNTLQLEINSLNSWTGNSTGIFVPYSATGQFYPSSNPSGFITNTSIGANSITGSGANSYIAKFTGTNGIATGSMYYDANGNILFSQGGKYTIGAFNGSNNPASLWLTGPCTSSSTQWNNMGAIFPTSDGVIEITNNGANGFGRLMFGGTSNAFPSIKVTGNSFALRLADDSDFTNLYVKNINITGNIFISGNSVVLSSQTGNLLNSTSTGILTGVFYPLNQNPLGYLTGFNSGLYALNSSTGNFITTGMTGAFGGGSTPTGNLTGAFYPLNSNPSGYLSLYNQSGSYIFATQITSGISQQFISFPTNLGTNPYVLCNLVNNLGYENILVQPSGVTSSGYWAQYSKVIDNTGYSLNTIASLSSSTGLATTVIINTNYRANTVSVGSSSTSQLVNFSSNFTGTNYAVSLTADSTLGTANSISATAKTISGFTITLTAGVVGGFNVDYTAFMYN